MQNKLYVGQSYTVALPRCACLFITTDFIDVPEWRRPRNFDYRTDELNPFANLDYAKSCMIVDVFDALFTAGPTTLTKEAGLDYIADVLENRPSSLKAFADLIPEPDKKSLPGHIWAYTKVKRILRSPVLSKALGGSTFTFKKGCVNQVRIGGLVRFDALALSLFATAQFSGQIVIPRLQASDFYLSVIHENRLIAGVPNLSQLKGLYNDAMSMEIEPHGCTYKDAVTLAENAGLRPDYQREDNPYNRFIAEAMAA